MLTRDFVQGLAKQLEAKAADAAPLLAAAREAHDADEVAAILLAKLIAGQTVPLAEVLAIASEVSVAELLLPLAARAKGTHAAAATKALTADVLEVDRQALLVAAAVLQGPKPKATPALKTALARFAKKDLPDTAYEVVVAVVHALGDEVLFKARQSLEKWMTAAEVKQVLESFALDVKDPLGLLPEGETPLPQLTVRHEGPEPGRNDPCPCGSGQKYKKCHGGSGGLEASPSSRAQRLAQLAPRLEPKHMRALWLADVRRLDPTTLSVQSHCEGARLLVDRRQWALAEAWWESYIPRTSNPDVAREELIFLAATYGQSALVKRQRAKLHDAGVVGPGIDFVLGLWGKHPALFAELEAMLGTALQGHDSRDAIEAAYSLLQHAPALGVALGEWLLPRIKSRAEAEELWWCIDVARDGLGLGRVPFLAEGGRLVAPKDRAQDRAPAPEQTPAPAPKAPEPAPHALSEELEAGRRRIGELEAQLAAATAPPTRAAPAPDGARRVLKDKVDELEARIREGNEERARLRKELAEAQGRLGRKDDRAPPEPLPAAANDDASDGADGSHARPRGLTWPTFTPRAREALEELPARVARDAMGRVAELTSGEASGWQEVKQLQGVAGLFSVRVGIHYRVLFTMNVEARTLVVEDVIARESFDTAIRRFK